MLVPVDLYTNSRIVANSVDLAQTPQNAASDLGLHYLLRPVCPITYRFYGKLVAVTICLLLFAAIMLSFNLYKLPKVSHLRYFYLISFGNRFI